MNTQTILYIIVFSFLGSVGSLIGGIILLWKERWARGVSLYLISFAAGALLTVAFVDLLPEALKEAEKIGVPSESIFPLTLGAIVIFFLLEHGLWWYHHHYFSEERHQHEIAIHSHRALLVTLGDASHNFIDGIIIAASFLVSTPLGVFTSLAVIAHEVPQEIADFGILLHMKVSRFQVFFYNILASLTTFIGASLVIFFASKVENLIPYFLAFAAGTFIYIASSDLIPDIHHKSEQDRSLLLVVVFFLGVVTILLTSLLE